MSYNTVDDLPDLVQKTVSKKQPPVKFNSVDELPDLKKKSSGGLNNSGTQSSPSTSQSPNDNQIPVVGLQKPNNKLMSGVSDALGDSEQPPQKSFFDTMRENVLRGQKKNAEDNDPIIKNKKAQDFLKADFGVDPNIDLTNPETSAGITSYYTNKKQELDNKAHDLKNKGQLIMDNEGADALKNPQFQQIKDELEAVDNHKEKLSANVSYILGQQLAKNPNADAKQVGKSVREFMQPENKTAAQQIYGDKLLTKEQIESRDYNDELAGISAKQDAIINDVNSGKISHDDAKVQYDALTNQSNTLEKRYPTVVLDALRNVVGDRIAEYRKNKDNALESGWHNIVMSEPSPNEMKGAIEELRKSGVEISPDQEKQIFATKEKIPLTSALGNFYHNLILNPANKLSNLLQNPFLPNKDNSEREKEFRNVNALAPVQGNEEAQIVDLGDGKKTVRMGENPDAGKPADILSWGQLNNAAQVGGTIGAYITANRVLGGSMGALGMGKTASNVLGNITSSAFLNASDYKKQAQQQGASEGMQDAYAVGRSIVDGLLFSEFSLNKAKSVAPAVEQRIAQDFLEKSKGGFEQNKFADWVVNTSKDLGKNVSILKAQQLSGIVADKMINPEQNANRDVTNELTSNLPADIIAVLPFSAMSGYHSMEGKKEQIRQAVSMAVADPVHFEQRMNDLVEQGKVKPQDAENKINYIKQLAEKAKSPDLNTNKTQNLNAAQRQDYAHSLVVEDNIKKGGEGLSDQVQKEETNTQVKQEQEFRKNVLLKSELGDKDFKDLTDQEKEKITVPDNVKVKTQPSGTEGKFTPIIVNEQGQHEVLNKSFDTQDEAKVYAENKIKQRAFEENIANPKDALPDLTVPIEGTDKKGVPVVEDVPAEVKGTPEEISKPIELNPNDTSDVHEKIADLNEMANKDPEEFVLHYFPEQEAKKWDEIKDTHEGDAMIEATRQIEEDKLLSKIPKNEQPIQEPKTEIQQPTETTEPPNKVPPEIGAETTEGEENPKGVAGISDIVRKERAAKLGTTVAESGEGWNVDDAIKRGQELRKQGIDPDVVLSDFNKTNAVSGDMMAVVQNRAFELATETEKAHEELLKTDSEENSKKFEDALKKEDKWLSDIKPMQTEFQKIGMGQQGVLKLNPNSYSSVKKEFGRVTEGATPNKAQEEKIKELTELNKKLQQQADDAEAKLIEQNDKAHNGDKGTKSTKTKKSHEDYVKERTNAFEAARQALKDLRSGKGGIGVSVPLVRELAAIAPHVGKIVKSLIEEGVTKLSDIVDRIHDEFKGDIAGLRKSDINDVIAGEYSKGKETDISPESNLKKIKDVETERSATGYLEGKKTEPTEEEKNIKRLENQLEKLKENKPKTEKPDREFSDKEKELQSQIDAEKEKIRVDASNKELERLQNKLAGKKDNKFSPEDAKAIWNYGQETYLDKGVSYRDMIKSVSEDLGLKWKQTSEAITSPKVKPVSDEMWKKQGELRRSQAITKKWVDDQSRSVYVRALLKASAAVRGVQVFGHAGVFMGTHAGMTLVQPTTWHLTIPAFFRAYKFAYGNEAAYEQSLEELKSRPLYNRFERLGLKNNPDNINTEEFQKSQTALGGWIKKVGLQGIKGFNALKVLRQDLAEYHYNKLTEADKKDDGVVKSIVSLVNNATGATNLKIPEAIQEVTFAGGMEAARWGKLTRNPLKVASIAAKALIHPNKVSAQDRVFAKVWASRVGQQLATYGSLLLANAAIQKVVNPKNPTNLFNPNDKDWLRPKFGNVTVDPTSGMMSTIDFIHTLAKVPFENKKELRGDTKTQAFGKAIISRVRGKLAPLYSRIWDMVTQTDYNGNQLPLSNIKPDAKHRNVGWLEYATSALPIPVAEGFHNMFQAAADNGTSPTKTSNIMQSLLLTVVSGTTGARANESESNNPKSPFTDEDYKNIPTFKKVKEEWGMELPNTSHTSEVITDEKNKTKKKLSDYPKEIQDKYDNVHKTNLDAELKGIFKTNKVYVKEYNKTDGSKEYSVSVLDKSGDKSYKKQTLDNLNTAERAEILSEAQKQATEKTKEKIFGKQ